MLSLNVLSQAQQPLSELVQLPSPAAFDNSMVPLEKPPSTRKKQTVRAELTDSFIENVANKVVDRIEPLIRESHPMRSPLIDLTEKHESRLVNMCFF